MITIIKRNGRREPLDISKIQKYTATAIKGLINVSQSELEVDAQITFRDGITSKEIQQTLIKTVNAYTFAAKGKLGLISEFEKSLPESKLFFAGGAFSNRAYGFNRLGAMDSNHDESGAKTLIDTSLEMSHPLYKNIEGALFYDATMISEKSFEFTIDFVHAIGVGLRYMTPIGPVKIDLGVNIEHKEDYALHFQIGQSF